MPLIFSISTVKGNRLHVLGNQDGKLPLDYALADKRLFKIAKRLVANGVGLDTVYKVHARRLLELYA